MQALKLKKIASVRFSEPRFPSVPLEYGSETWNSAFDVTRLSLQDAAQRKLIVRRTQTKIFLFPRYLMYSPSDLKHP